MNALVFVAADERDTDRLGAALAAVLPAGTAIALSGTLGAGKTRFVQGLAAALGVLREEVVSPTFVLCQQYVGTRTIYHLDAYRLQDEDELREIGIDEMFASDGLVVIEWAERVCNCLPDERLEIEIDVAGPTSRTFTLRARGEALTAALEELNGRRAAATPRSLPRSDSSSLADVRVERSPRWLGSTSRARSGSEAKSPSTSQDSSWRGSQPVDP